MEVRPALLWVLAVMSALVGALVGIVFEGLLDNYLIPAANPGNHGISSFARMEEVLATVVGAALGAAFVGLVAFVAYRLFLSARR